MGRRVKLLEEALNGLRWLGYVLRISTERLPRCILFFEASSGWKTVGCDRSMARQTGMQTTTDELDHLGPIKLPGWSPRALSKR